MAIRAYIFTIISLLIFVTLLPHISCSVLVQTMKPRYGATNPINEANETQNGQNPDLGTSLFSLMGTKWPSSKYQLTYKVDTSTLVSGTENMRSVVNSVVNKWGQYSPFRFQEVTEDSASDLVYSFYNTIDGPGNTLGLSFRPSDGRSFYDAAEMWSDDNNPGQDQIDLESVALHETGHLLGLAHSSDPNAVMYYAIGPGMVKRELQQDDIDGIHYLYGSK